jgi:RNA polymerase sigma-70 factor, ECF subfamily
VASDLELVRTAARGGREAFADLYERHLDSVYRYFYYRLGHQQDAEDLTEQVFLKAWQALPGYRERGVPFLAWLYRIAHNQLIDHRRTNHAAADLDGLPEVASSGDAAFESAVAQAEAAELAAALAQLSPVEREVVSLRFVAALDHRTVAGIVGKSEVATRAIQSRALARLARLLGAREEAPA